MTEERKVEVTVEDTPAEPPKAPEVEVDVTVKPDKDKEDDE